MGHGPHRPGSFSGAGVVPSIAGLFLWFNAGAGITLNGTDVQIINDQSGNGRSAQNTTAANQPFWNASYAPLNNQPAMVFSYANNDFLATAGFTITQPTTIFSVSYLTDEAQNHYLYDGLSSTHRNALFQYATPDKYETMVAGGVIDTSPHFLPKNVPAVQCAEFNGALSRLFINNKTTTHVSGNAGSQTLDGLSLAAAYTGGAVFDGAIAEVIIYQALLSAADRKAVMDYLGGKYAIAIGA